MAYRVLIRNKATGEERWHEEPNDTWDEGASFMWFEGNYSCDCNQALFFARAGGEPDPGCECGDVGYVIARVEADGKAVYDVLGRGMAR